MEQVVQKKPNVVIRVFRFYMDGFRRMTLGRTLWKVILIKLIIMFGVLKLFFFHDFLGTKFSTDEQRAEYVLSELTGPVQNITQGGEEE
ncbi:MAG: DUF4492 domain-containing protein [Desulfobulbaceae bacterium]|nr:DUF4492 domain-containing protein [Desulfobulbaceae bacterium]